MTDFLQKLMVKPGAKVRLANISPDETFGWTEDEAREQTEKNLARIAELQDLLYADRRHNILMVVQGMDASGKDGVIKDVGGAMNPMGIRVASFKKPTEEELKHDFLWRIEKQMPGTITGEGGEVVFFNRSHYEDVLIARVHNLVPQSVWSLRYDQINEFEAEHVAKGTHILKFFLYVSKEEQLERLKDRMEEPRKRWKVNPSDFAERAYWDDYQRAYEDALAKCSTDDAPWIIIPADRKWFRDLVVSEILVDYLEGLDMAYPQSEAEIKEINEKYLNPRPPSPPPGKIQRPGTRPSL